MQIFNQTNIGGKLSLGQIFVPVAAADVFNADCAVIVADCVSSKIRFGHEPHNRAVTVNQKLRRDVESAFVVVHFFGGKIFPIRFERAERRPVNNDSLRDNLANDFAVMFERVLVAQFVAVFAPRNELVDERQFFRVNVRSQKNRRRADCQQKNFQDTLREMSSRYFFNSVNMSRKVSQSRAFSSGNV